MRSRARALAAFVVLGAIALPSAAGCVSATVVRVIDGREVRGRFVSDKAYALYARGAEAEARGDFEGARVHYLAAAEEDQGSAEIWARVGATSCRLGRADEAAKAFETALGQDSAYEPAFRERATCALSRDALTKDEARAALEDAARSLALDPDTEDAALLYARAAEAAGEIDLAERALRELCARSPRRAAGWTALRDLADRQALPAASARARVALAALDVAPPSATVAPSRSPAGSFEDVDEAIARDALDEARTAAKRARVTPAELAVRAAALGHAKLAKAQAELVFKADPSSASAAIALAVASDLLRDDAALAVALADPAALTTPPSALARQLFAELIARRVDREAARAYAGPTSPAKDVADPLLRAVTDRVSALLGKP